MQVALITVVYPPSRSSAAVQMRDLAAEFLAQGHHPVVLVPDETLRDSWSLETLDGVPVLRLRAFPTRDVGYLSRIVGEFLLPWSMRRGLRASPMASAQWDAVVWYSPSIFFGPLVTSLKHASGCRSYLILRDIFPDWAVDLGLLRRGLVYRMLKAVERRQHEAADVIGIQAPSNRGYLAPLERHRPDIRLEVLWNWLAPAPNVGCSIDIGATSLAGRTIFVYIGNMGVAQGLDILLELMESLAESRDIGFVFVGRGSELPKLRGRAQEHALQNALFFDEIDPREIPGLLAQCHIGLLALDPRHQTHNIPGKFLAYLQAGLPVLARVNLNNDLVGLIEREDVGYVDRGGSVQSLRELALRMSRDAADRAAKADRGRRLARRQFSPQAAVHQILEALQTNG
jgi:glycosyltransferase involved in cell wall biosynthesis